VLQCTGYGVQLKSGEEHALFIEADGVELRADTALEQRAPHVQVVVRATGANPAFHGGLLAPARPPARFDGDNAARASRRRTSPQREQGEEIISR